MQKYNIKLEEQFKTTLLKRLSIVSDKERGTISTKELFCGIQVLGHTISDAELCSTCPQPNHREKEN